MDKGKGEGIQCGDSIDGVSMAPKGRKKLGPRRKAFDNFLRKPKVTQLQDLPCPQLLVIYTIGLRWSISHFDWGLWHRVRDR